MFLDLYLIVSQRSLYSATDFSTFFANFRSEVGVQTACQDGGSDRIIKNLVSEAMTRSAICVCSIACFLCLVFTILLKAEGPMLSSRAIRTALQAKEAIEGHDEKALKSAVDSLKAILKESSFHRLEPQAQVQILLLLSKGLERLEKYKEQEHLLLSYAKKDALHRFQVPLKTALARSFVQQHRFAEADHLLAKMIKSSCSHLSLEEKNALADILRFRDEYVSCLLRQGNHLTETGKWEEALSLYQTVTAALQQQRIPFQSSSLEKKKIRQKLLLRIAEVHFCLGNFHEVISLLTTWDDMLCLNPADQPLVTRRLFLIASAHHNLRNSAAAYQWFHQYFSSPYFKRPVLDRHLWCSPINEDTTPTPALLLWKAHEALQVHSSALLSECVTVLRDNIKSSDNIFHILQGFHAALEHNLPVAMQELIVGLSKPATAFDAPWREAAYHLLANCGFERMVLLAISNQPLCALQMARQLVPLCALSSHPETLLRVGAFHLLIFRLTQDTSALISVQNILTKVAASERPYNQAFFTILRAAHTAAPPQEGLCNLEALSLCDRMFATWLGIPEMRSSGLDLPSEEGDDGPIAPCARYVAALSLYQQAMADELSSEQALSSLHECLTTPGLEDTHPQLMHCLIDLALHTGQWAEADELLRDLMTGYPSYPPLPQAMLSCIFAFDEVPTLADERIMLIQHLFDREQHDVHTLMLMLHLFETRQQLPLDQKNAIPPFGLALIARSEARNLVVEAYKSKEPSVIKERVESAAKAFLACRSYALESLETLSDPEALCVAWGLIFAIEHEQIELFERYITTDSAFNELPSLLEEAAYTLRKDLSDFQATIPPDSQVISPAFVHTSLCSSLTADLYAETFRRNIPLAISKAKEFPESWYASRHGVRSVLYLAKILRESNKSAEAMELLSHLQERAMCEDVEVSLEIAMEKSLCLRELHRPDKAMALLAWVINGPYASSLRVKAMILRADLYLSLHRTDLAVRQLESVAAKGGEWGAVADRKLRELYGTN